MNLQTLTKTQFSKLPLIASGESKEIRDAGNGQAIIKLKPTIYSYTYNRAGIIKGSDKLRLQACQILIPVLKTAGIEHTYIEINNRWICSKLLPELKDIQYEKVASAAVVPIEVIVKKYHTGTPKHRYYKFGEYVNKFGGKVGENNEYPGLVVRFDWRNPLLDNEGNRLCDEVLPEDMAGWFIDVPAAKKTALKAFNTLSNFFGERGLELWDICFFIASDGKTLYGEISPDCMRLRSKLGDKLDKDIWRAGGSSEDVLQKWQRLVDIIRS